MKKEGWPIGRKDCRLLLPRQWTSATQRTYRTRVILRFLKRQNKRCKRWRTGPIWACRWFNSDRFYPRLGSLGRITGDTVKTTVNTIVQPVRLGNKRLNFFTDIFIVGNGASDWALCLNSYCFQTDSTGYTRVSNCHWLLFPSTATIESVRFRLSLSKERTIERVNAPRSNAVMSPMIGHIRKELKIIFQRRHKEEMLMTVSNHLLFDNGKDFYCYYATKAKRCPWGRTHWRWVASSRQQRLEECREIFEETGLQAKDGDEN